MVGAIEAGGGEAEFVRADLESPDEIAIKVSIGKLTLRRSLANFEAAVIEAGFQTLDVTMRHAAAVAEVSARQSDPFDRPLLAQCEIETLKLLTADRYLKALPQSVSADRARARRGRAGSRGAGARNSHRVAPAMLQARPPRRRLGRPTGI